MAIKIVSDSTADIPADLAERLGITVVPAYVLIDDVAYREGVDITRKISTSACRRPHDFPPPRNLPYWTLRNTSNRWLTTVIKLCASRCPNS